MPNKFCGRGVGWGGNMPCHRFPAPSSTAAYSSTYVFRLRKCMPAATGAHQQQLRRAHRVHVGAGRKAQDCLVLAAVGVLLDRGVDLMDVGCFDDHSLWRAGLGPSSSRSVPYSSWPPSRPEHPTAAVRGPAAVCVLCQGQGCAVVALQPLQLCSQLPPQHTQTVRSKRPAAGQLLLQGAG